MKCLRVSQRTSTAEQFVQINLGWSWNVASMVSPIRQVALFRKRILVVDGSAGGPCSAMPYIRSVAGVFVPHLLCSGMYCRQ